MHWSFGSTAIYVFHRNTLLRREMFIFNTSYLIKDVMTDDC